MIRNNYTLLGVDTYYEQNYTNYVNPHLNSVHKSLDYILDNTKITNFLDLSCGNGEVSEYLLNKGISDFEGSDPYFYDVYKLKFKKNCYNLRFENIALEGLKKYETIISSYALHLCPKTYLNQLLYQLSISCKQLIIISPNKFPEISNYFKLENKHKIDKTHISIFKSLN